MALSSYITKPSISCIIRTSVYPDGQCVSTGGYYDHRQLWHHWEYIGSYSYLRDMLEAMLLQDAEFQHVVTRHY